MRISPRQWLILAASVCVIAAMVIMGAPKLPWYYLAGTAAAAVVLMTASMMFPDPNEKRGMTPEQQAEVDQALNAEFADPVEIKPETDTETPSKVFVEGGWYTPEEIERVARETGVDIKTVAAVMKLTTRVRSGT